MKGCSRSWGSDRRSLVLHELNKEASVDPQFIAALEAVRDSVLIADSISQGHVPARKAAVRLRGVDKRQVHIVPQHRGHRNQQTRAFLPGVNLDADIHLFL